MRPTRRQIDSFHPSSAVGGLSSTIEVGTSRVVDVTASCGLHHFPPWEICHYFAFPALASELNHACLLITNSTQSLISFATVVAEMVPRNGPPVMLDLIPTPEVTLHPFSNVVSLIRRTVLGTRFQNSHQNSSTNDQNSSTDDCCSVR